MKCVIIIDKDLPGGLAANTASVLAFSLGAKYPDWVGPDTVDSDGRVHPGLIRVPIPILAAEKHEIQEIHHSATNNHRDNLSQVSVTNIAQRSKNYQSYTDSISKASSNNLLYLGIGLLGNEKIITSLSGSLPLYR